MDDSTAQITRTSHGNHDETRARVLAFLRHLQEPDCRLETLEPLLPLLLNVDGSPMTLTDHFHFTPLYRTHLPDARILKAARQVGKSTYAASSGLCLANRFPRFTQLYVTPLYEQIRRFSVNTVAPMIEESPIKSLMVDTKCIQAVLQRTFRNRSMLLFSYAYQSAG
jgi:hypothetical protein